MKNSLLTNNYSSSNLKFLADNFDRKSKSQESFSLLENSVVVDAQKPPEFIKNDLKTPNKKHNWVYLSGAASAVGQLIAGSCMMLEVILGKKGKVSPKAVNALGRIGWWSMGLSYAVSMPSCIGASLKAKQPAMLLGSIIWGISSPFMIMKKFQNAARVVASTPLGAGFIYTGMANKIKNDNELKKGENPRVFDFKNFNRHNFISKTWDMIKFAAKDLSELPRAGIKAVSQSWDFVAGKRKEVPEFLTIKPTQNNSKLAGLLLIPGATLLMIFQKKNKHVEKLANVLIGTGLLSEALYMFTLGNSKKGIDRGLIISGVPLRAIGDYATTNRFALGMRTMGGASFEYYFATLNKDDEPQTSKLNKKVFG